MPSNAWLPVFEPGAGRQRLRRMQGEAPCPESRGGALWPTALCWIRRKTESVIVGNTTFAESAAPPLPHTPERISNTIRQKCDPSAGSDGLNRPRRTPEREAAVSSPSLRRSPSLGIRKGPQSLGTLTLPARTSVLYLRARDRHTRPAALRFSPPGPARRYTVPRSRRYSPNTIIRYARILCVILPLSVSNQFHNAWYLQPFGSYFRMTANAFSLPFIHERNAPVRPAQ